MSNFHHTKAYRHWKKRVTIRGKGVCAVTGSKLNLRTHHLYNVKDHPKFKTHIKKGLLITYELHNMFHVHFKGSYQEKCTAEDWKEFKKELETNIDLFIKSNLL